MSGDAAAYIRYLKKQNAREDRAAKPGEGLTIKQMRQVGAVADLALIADEQAIRYLAAAENRDEALAELSPAQQGYYLTILVARKIKIRLRKA